MLMIHYGNMELKHDMNRRGNSHRLRHVNPVATIPEFKTPENVTNNIYG